MRCLRGVLVKLFSDRQIAAAELTISFMLARMPRSLGAARLLVAEIDRRALEERAEVTCPFVAKVMGDFSAPGLFGDEASVSFTRPHSALSPTVILAYYPLNF